jgi:predicted nucleic acid-binding protein
VARDLRAGAAYDSFYIALAEALQCEFWTGDKSLYNNAHDKMAFVRSIWEGGAMDRVGH